METIRRYDSGWTIVNTNGLFQAVYEGSMRRVSYSLIELEEYVATQEGGSVHLYRKPAEYGVW